MDLETKNKLISDINTISFTLRMLELKLKNLPQTKEEETNTEKPPAGAKTLRQSNSNLNWQKSLRS